MTLRRLAPVLAAFTALGNPVDAQTPVTGHYPPGQTGMRGATTPDPGLSVTNFNRFFTNLAMMDASGARVEGMHELRYANITMVTWTSSWTILGLRFGSLGGVPVATGDISSGQDPHFGLGDILLTPVSLYGKRSSFDYQFQFTVWTPSGHFSPGSSRNRGTGFWALIYSVGGVYYPSGDRAAWSISAVARTEQNFEQRASAIRPGHDVVMDWGVGRMFGPADHRMDLGVSGFGAWQLSPQRGGAADIGAQRYQLLGIGPEASLSLSRAVAVRARAHWEFAARSIVRGNNLWLILNYAF